jgi:hypothetical protein
MIVLHRRIGTQRILCRAVSLAVTGSIDGKTFLVLISINIISAML